MCNILSNGTKVIDRKQTMQTNISILIFAYLSSGIFCKPFNLKQVMKEQLRLGGSRISSKNIVGPRMCIAECLRRFPFCLSVNYVAETLTCELNYQSERNDEAGFVMFQAKKSSFIDVTTLTDKEKVLNSTLYPGSVCWELKSRKTVCIEESKPRDCMDLRRQGSALNGVYRMFPNKKDAVLARCDMETDQGGWTVFQYRHSGKTNFTKDWNSYKDGFGNVIYDHWLGNENLHTLIKKGESEMRFDMAYPKEASRYVIYDYFYVGNEASGYEVNLTVSSGITADCLASDFAPINGNKFSTYNRDFNNCSQTNKGGWWYGDPCYCANPNGVHGVHGSPEGMVYYNTKGVNQSLIYTKMMIRRKL